MCNMADSGLIEDRIAVKLKNSSKPRAILLFSGKRKSGKDYITNVLQGRLGDGDSVIIKLSGPIKLQWAKSEGLNFDDLLSDGEYKEAYRCRMAKWGECIRRKDHGYFCREAIDMYNAYNKPIWIVSDVRRKTDIQWFVQNFGDVCKTIRIASNDSIRSKRGWTFVPGMGMPNALNVPDLSSKLSTGIDDAETECDLDDNTSWNLRITNNGEDVETILEQILQLVR